jgi:hypothetical protein
VVEGGGVSRLAKITSTCAAGCGRLIREGVDQSQLIAQPDGGAHYVHPECVDDYERKVAARDKPVRNARISDEAQAEFVEHMCGRCGADYAGRPGDATGVCACGGDLVVPGEEPVPPLLVCERCGLNGTMEQRKRGLPATCTKLGYMVKPSARRPGMGPASTCGGRLVPGEVETPAWLRHAFERLTASTPDAAAAASAEPGGDDRDAATTPSSEEPAEPVRSPYAGRPRKHDPQEGLPVDASPEGELASRDDAAQHEQRNPEGSR